MNQMNVLRTFELRPTPLNKVRVLPQFSGQLKRKFSLLPNSTQKRVSSMGVGIEVEVENAGGMNGPFGWITEADNSLRNHGLEFKTRFGSRYHELPELIESLFNLFKETRKRAGPQYFDFSERTSIHVHLDVRSLTADEVISLLMIYTIFEDALFEFAGPIRKDNVFCVPLRFTRLSLDEILTLRDLPGSWSKYTAINLIPMSNFGTIEFRHMEGNDDTERVLTWVTLLSLMMDYVKMHTREEVMDNITLLKLSSNYVQFVEEVFGPFASSLPPINDLDRAVSDAKLFFPLFATMEPPKVSVTDELRQIQAQMANMDVQAQVAQIAAQAAQNFQMRQGIIDWNIAPPYEEDIVIEVGGEEPF